MQSFRQSEVSSASGVRVQLPVPTDVIISLSSLPLVAAIATGNMVADGLAKAGLQSEELFRGERLPSLPLMVRS